jgi:hypothetical protein
MSPSLPELFVLDLIPFFVIRLEPLYPVRPSSMYLFVSLQKSETPNHNASI